MLDRRLRITWSLWLSQALPSLVFPWERKGSCCGIEQVAPASILYALIIPPSAEIANGPEYPPGSPEKNSLACQFPWSCSEHRNWKAWFQNFFQRGPQWSTYLRLLFQEQYPPVEGLARDFYPLGLPSFFSIRGLPVARVFSWVWGELLAIMEKDILADAHVLHELTQRTIVWLDVWENLLAIQPSCSWG